MTRFPTNGKLVVLAAMCLGVIVVGLQTLQPAVSQEPATPGIVRLEYTTAQVHTSALQAKLTELGDAGWEVFSIVRAELVLVSEVNGASHLRAEELLVSARRVKR